MASEEFPRPTVLTPEAKAAILEIVGEGGYLKSACDAGGFTYRMLCYWRQKFEEGDPNAQVHADFFHDLKKASAKAERDALKTLRQGEPGWQANAWFLERRFSQRWGRQDRTPKPATSGATAIDELREKLAEDDDGTQAKAPKGR